MSQRRLVAVDKYVETDEHLMLFNSGDWHYGNLCCERDAIDCFVDRVLSYDGPKAVILQGDLIECIEPSDARFDWGAVDYTEDGEPIDITSQKNLLISTMLPIAKYIIGYHIGNHEHKMHRQGHRVVSEYATLMGAMSDGDWNAKYLGYTADIKIRLINEKSKKHPFFCVSTHGYGGASKRQTKLKKVKDFLLENPFIVDEGKIHQVQAAYMGHLHDLLHERVHIDIPHYDVGRKIAMPSYAAVTGHFLNASAYNKDSYAIKFGLTPTPIGWIETLIDPEGRVVYVEPFYCC